MSNIYLVKYWHYVPANAGAVVLMSRIGKPTAVDYHIRCFLHMIKTLR